MSLEKKVYSHGVIASFKACITVTIGGNDFGSSKLIGQILFVSFIGGFASGLRDQACVILLFLLIQCFQ